MLSLGAPTKRGQVQYCQSHDVKNLFICDTSVFVSGSGVNPTLTAMAIAERSAEYIIKEHGRGARATEGGR